MLGQSKAQSWSYSPNYRRPRHFHNEPELNIVVGGSATMGVGSRVLTVHAGEILCFPPGQDHVLLGTSRDLALLSVGVGAELSADVLSCQRVRVPLPLHVKPPVEEFRQLVNRASAVAGRANQDALVAELWERVHRAGFTELGHDRRALHVLTRRTLEVIAASPELGRDSLARYARGIPSEVSRYFHRDLGTTLVKYRTRLRLLKFITLIDHHSCDLTAASHEAGFGSYSQCHRAFQSEFDCSPGQFFFSGIRQQFEESFVPASL